MHPSVCERSSIVSFTFSLITGLSEEMHRGRARGTSLVQLPTYYVC